jgi:hypothetical protein
MGEKPDSFEGATEYRRDAHFMRATTTASMDPPGPDEKVAKSERDPTPRP